MSLQNCIIHVCSCVEYCMLPCSLQVKQDIRELKKNTEKGGEDAAKG